MLDELFLFIKLVEAGSFSAVARNLGMTQATVSRRLQTLEERLGVVLIQRNTRNFEVSEIGHKFYETFRYQENNVLTQIDDLLQEQRDVSGTLRVSLPAALSKNVISPHVVDFIQQYPAVNLHIRYSATPIDLNKENMNLVVTSIMPSAQSYLVRLLYKFHLQLFASPEYLRNNGEVKSLADLNRHFDTIGLLSSEDVAVTNYTLTNLISGATHILNTNPRIYLNNSIHSVEMALSGKVMAGAWDALVQDELKSGKLVKILPEYSLGEIPCYLVRRPGNPSLLEQRFISFLEECFANLPPQITN